MLSFTDLAFRLEPKEGSGGPGREASLLVSEHVTEEAGRLLRSEGACYLDAGGNCYLRQGPLLAFVRGQETAEGASSERPMRAFNAAGLKLIFVLLAREAAAGWAYRRLSKVAGVSRGAVGYVMEDLGRLGFLEEVEGKRRLRRKPELLERWPRGFAERLRPKLSRGRFGFVDENGQARWRQLELASRKAQWGGRARRGSACGRSPPEATGCLHSGGHVEDLQRAQARARGGGTRGASRHVLGPRSATGTGSGPSPERPARRAL